MFIELFFSWALLAGPIMLVISGFIILVGTFGPNRVDKTWPQSKLSFKFMFIDKTCRGVNVHLIINPCILWIIFMHYREGKLAALYVDGVEYRIKRHIIDSSVLSMCQFICLASNASLSIFLLLFHDTISPCAHQQFRDNSLPLLIPDRYPPEQWPPT